ncbi:MAG: flagellar filament outer layer protein FlaA [Spirochaetaceae bacterium]|nr:flagellar filament outer layer protein FlaA [Spirochaetaceae bacterium]
MKLFCLVVFISLPVAWAFSDSNTVELQSKILDNFDGTPYSVDGEEYNYTWKAVGSKFSTKTDSQTFPVISPIAAVPQALLRQYPNIKSLGIQGAFDRHGYNWIDIYPTLADGDGQPVEIPLTGRTRFVDAWVWGSNLNYSLEIYIRDNRGIIHGLPIGSLKYIGWKNLRVAVPAGIPMVSNVLPRSIHDTTFVKFRIWTSPEEKTYVDLKRDVSGNVTEIVPFYVYIAQLKVLSDIYETVYDGDELGYPKKTAELWGADGAAQNNQN